MKEPKPKTLADAWILNRLREVVAASTEHIEKYNFSYAGELLRDFTWGELADWYLEIAKVEGSKSQILNYVLNTILKLWHPFMPFVTETIWQQVYGEDAMLMVEKWPVQNKKKIEGADEFNLVAEIITAIRSARSEKKIEPAKLLSATISASGTKADLVAGNMDSIKKLARLENLDVISGSLKSGNKFLVRGMEIALDTGGAVDTKKEKSRLEADLANTERYLRGLAAKLNNSDFLSRAPAVVVEGEKGKLEEAKEKIEKLKLQLKNL